MGFFSSITDSVSTITGTLWNSSGGSTPGKTPVDNATSFISQYFYRGVVILTGFIFLIAGLTMFARPIELITDSASKSFRKKKHGR